MSDPAPSERPKRRGRGAPPAVTRKVNSRNLKNRFPPMKDFSDDRKDALDAYIAKETAKGGAEPVS